MCSVLSKGMHKAARGTNREALNVYSVLSKGMHKVARGTNREALNVLYSVKRHAQSS